MTMKRFLITMAVAALALGTFADTEPPYQMIYWQVTPESLGTDNPYTSYATIFAVAGEGSSIEIPNSVAGDTVFATPDAGSDPIASGNHGMTAGWDTLDLSGMSFFVELMDNRGDTFSRSEAVTYASLMAGGYVAQGGVGSASPVSSTGVYAFGGWTAVPEPTSGLLVLFGLAALGLKRKRA